MQFSNGASLETMFNVLPMDQWMNQAIGSTTSKKAAQKFLKREVQRSFAPASSLGGRTTRVALC